MTFGQRLAALKKTGQCSRWRAKSGGACFTMETPVDGLEVGWCQTGVAGYIRAVSG